MLIMRTYALYDRNKRVLSFILVVTLSALGIGIVRLSYLICLLSPDSNALF